MCSTAHAPSGVWAFLWCSNRSDPMNTIDTYGQPVEVPCANGQLEPAYTYRHTAPTLLDQLCHLSDEEWFIQRAKIDGRVAADIDPSLQNNVDYLRAYLKGAHAVIDARLVLPTRRIEQEAAILLEFAQFTAATVRRLRQLDQDLAGVDEPWAE